MFDRLGLHRNLGKTKAIVCTSGFIWRKQGTEAHKKRATGEGDMLREWKKTRVS